jgi:hypothetical protein
MSSTTTSSFTTAATSPPNPVINIFHKDFLLLEDYDDEVQIFEKRFFGKPLKSPLTGAKYILGRVTRLGDSLLIGRLLLWAVFF